MWDTVQTNQEHLSHDMPCARCGHAAHTYLACSDTCACVPPLLPALRRRSPSPGFECDPGPLWSGGSAHRPS
jgi:hypothetical protein